MELGFKKWVFGTVLEGFSLLLVPFFLAFPESTNRTVPLIFSLLSSFMLLRISIFRYFYNFVHSIKSVENLDPDVFAVLCQGQL